MSTTPFAARAYNRAFNIVGNVIGQAGYHDTYESYATSPTAGVNGSKVDTSIYSLGWTGNTGNGGCNTPPVCDAAVRSTLMRWGNYDTVNAGVAVELDGSISRRGGLRQRQFHIDLLRFVGSHSSCVSLLSLHNPRGGHPERMASHRS